MSRPLRVEYAGALYHVMSRGNRGDCVFAAERDCRLFLAKLGGMCTAHDVRVLTYCLEPTHVHLLIQTRQPNLSRFMQGLLTAFSVAKNRLDEVDGHVFQGRFRAQLLEGPEYVRQLSRHIHLQPVGTAAERGGVEEKMSRLLEYRWSSLPYLIGLRAAPDWLDPLPVLRGFGTDEWEQTAAYRRYVEEGLWHGVAPPAGSERTGSILGSRGFVEWVRREFLLGRPSRPRDEPELAGLQSGVTLDTVVSAVAGQYGLPLAQVLKDRRTRYREARQVLLYLACCHCRSSRTLTDVSAELGITLPGLAAARERMLGKLRRNARLAARVAAIRTALPRLV